MPMTRLSMRKVKEILRLALEVGLGAREIGRSLSVAHPTVLRYLEQAKQQSLTWAVAQPLDDVALQRLLAGPKATCASADRPQPDYEKIHRELKRKGMTLQLLWQEYKEAHPSGYQYTQFCEHYHRFAQKLDYSLRQIHKAGERLFVDYAGQTVPLIDPRSGEIQVAQIFVAVLGASNYTYAEASLSQDLPSFISAHIRAFEYFGGVPSILVPDNLKSAVTRSCRYEPEINRTYQEMAMHYGIAILPARAGMPKDKAKVETGVLIVERWILAALRNQSFFSLAELNALILRLLAKLNARPFKSLPAVGRASLRPWIASPSSRFLPPVTSMPNGRRRA